MTYVAGCVTYWFFWSITAARAMPTHILIAMSVFFAYYADIEDGD
ncbi:MAG: hypothetical protein V4735_01175 [Pseudomonadota bacterium]